MKRDDLVSRLNLIKAALSDKDLVPTFQLFCFKGKSVHAYNDELGIIAPLPKAPSKNFGVHGDTLLGLLSNSNSEEMELTFEENGESVQIKAGRSKIKLPYIEDKDFLFEEPKKNWHSEINLTENDIAGLEFCLACAAKSQAMPAGLNVTFTPGIKKTPAFLYSCDEDSISRYKLEGTSKGSSSSIMSLPFCESIVRFIKELKLTKAQIQFSSDWAYSELGGYHVYGRMPATDPLDHADQIKTAIKGTPQYIPLPVGFGHALKRACVLSEKSGNKSKLTITNNKMVILTETHMGTCRDVLNVKGSGHPDVDVFVSAPLIQRAIEHCDEMAVMENCTVYQQGESLFQLAANIGG